MYRILLPSLIGLEPKAFARTVMTLPDAVSVDGDVSWEVGSLPDLNGYAAGTDAEVHLLSTEEVARERTEPYFYAPKGVRCWVEVRALGAMADRTVRLRARLIALQLSHALNLPVLETRNGVMCTTPEAFAAWCARRSHNKVQRLGGWEHFTTAPERPKLVLKANEPTPAAAEQNLTPPTQSNWLSRTWRRMRGRHRYVIALPDTSLTVAEALRDEVGKTFPKHRVRYRAASHELVISADDTSHPQDAVDESGKAVQQPRSRPAPPPSTLPTISFP